MEISVYNLIKGPLLSEKAQHLNQELNKLVLEVHMCANKPLIKSALKKLFNVEVANVRIQIRKGKSRSTRGRLATVGSDRKIAYVTLKKGHTLDLFGHGQQQQNMPEQEQQKQELNNQTT